VTSNFELNKQAEARAVQVAVKTDALKRWLAEKHPEIPLNTATLNAFTDDMGDAFLTASDEDFEFALRTMKTGITPQRVPTPEETKAGLIENICSLIASSDGTGRDGKFSTYSLQTERSKMSHWSVPQLTERLSEVVRKQELSKKSAVELHQIVESGRKYVGYPALGKTIVPPGKVRAVPLDAAYLKSLDLWDLKRLCRLYGVEQINDRLAGRS
jgi:hypothetical protein